MVRKQTTKELLSASLRELTEKMPFERITVKHIVQNCGVSSTTFYHHFLDKYDLVEWIYRKDSEQFVEKISDDYTWRDAALNTLLVFRSNIEYYRSYFRSESTADNLNMITYAEAVDTIRKLHGEDSMNEEIRFILQLYLSGVSKMTIEWIMDERTEMTPEVFTDHIMEAMPEKIRKLLFP